MKAFVVVFGSPIQIGGPYLVVAVFWHDGDVHTVRATGRFRLAKCRALRLEKVDSVDQNFPVFPLKASMSFGLPNCTSMLPVYNS